MNFWYRIRFPLMLLGMISLIAGLWAGLLRLGWDLPTPQPFLPEGHGPFMVAGFLGVVIGLERAVALGHKWSYLVPFLNGVGGILVIVGFGSAGAALMTLSAAVLIGVNAAIMRDQLTDFTIIMGIGSIALLMGNALWFLGEPVYTVVTWWSGFLVLTIVAERLELSRYLTPPAWAQWLFTAATAIFVLGMVWMSVDQDSGAPVAGLGLIALAAWLGRFDVARRTVKQPGLTRFVAVCLISGYFWLALGGVMMLFAPSWEPGYYYDATLHSIFLGFVFSMIFGHAPIIAPAVLRVEVPYTPLFYIHLVLLHISLLARVGADHAGSDAGHMWGGLINEAALIFFIANTVRAAVLAKMAKAKAG